jgi:hypothetical protein
MLYSLKEKRIVSGNTAFFKGSWFSFKGFEIVERNRKFF